MRNRDSGLSRRQWLRLGPTAAAGLAAASLLRRARGEDGDEPDGGVAVNNLKQIGLAMHNYLSASGSFPPAAMTDGDKPLLSWRVAILPYLEQQELFDEFHLGEPWDSPHNKKLMMEKAPAVFTTPRLKGQEKYETFYQGFVGPGAFFDGVGGTPIAAITDGTSNTLMVVEAGRAVPWTKPADLVYDPDKPVGKLGGLFKGDFHALYADGSVHFLAKDNDNGILQQLITRAGGEVIDMGAIKFAT
jgi:hypothetical protein